MIEMPELAAFWDVLIPGYGDWPSASAAIPEHAVIAAELPADDQAWLQAASARVLAAANRTHAMQALERDSPAAFGRMLKALYDIYYQTASVCVVVERLADAGPRELLEVFDETMLRQVIQTQAGSPRPHGPKSGSA
jgi:hypothetical protein